MQYVYMNPKSIVLIDSQTPAEKFPVNVTKLIREYNDDSSHLTYINKY